MKRFKNVLSATEPVSGNGPAFERVVALAEENQARVTVVSLLEEVSGRRPGCRSGCFGTQASRHHGREATTADG